MRSINSIDFKRPPVMTLSFLAAREIALQFFIIEFKNKRVESLQHLALELTLQDLIYVDQPYLRHSPKDDKVVVTDDTKKLADWEHKCLPEKGLSHVLKIKILSTIAQLVYEYKNFHTLYVALKKNNLSKNKLLSLIKIYQFNTFARLKLLRIVDAVCSFGEVAQLKWILSLLKEDADITNLIMSGFCSAANLNRIDVLTFILNRPGINKDEILADNKYGSAYQLACEQGHIEVLNILYKYASPAIINQFHSTKIHTGLARACELGRIEVVALILDKIKDQDIKNRLTIGPMNPDGWPFLNAVIGGDTDVMTLLHSHTSTDKRACLILGPRPPLAPGQELILVKSLLTFFGYVMQSKNPETLNCFLSLCDENTLKLLLENFWRYNFDFGSKHESNNRIQIPIITFLEMLNTECLNRVIEHRNFQNIIISIQAKRKKLVKYLLSKASEVQLKKIYALILANNFFIGNKNNNFWVLTDIWGYLKLDEKDFDRAQYKIIEILNTLSNRVAEDDLKTILLILSRENKLRFVKEFSPRILAGALMNPNANVFTLISACLTKEDMDIIIRSGSEPLFKAATCSGNIPFLERIWSIISSKQKNNLFSHVFPKLFYKVCKLDQGQAVLFMLNKMPKKQRESLLSSDDYRYISIILESSALKVWDAVISKFPSAVLIKRLTAFEAFKTACLKSKFNTVEKILELRMKSSEDFSFEQYYKIFTSACDTRNLFLIDFLMRHTKIKFSQKLLLHKDCEAIFQLFTLQTTMFSIDPGHKNIRIIQYLLRIANKETKVKIKNKLLTVLDEKYLINFSLLKIQMFACAFPGVENVQKQLNLLQQDCSNFIISIDKEPRLKVIAYWNKLTKIGRNILFNNKEYFQTCSKLIESDNSDLIFKFIESVDKSQYKPLLMRLKMCAKHLGKKELVKSCEDRLTAFVNGDVPALKHI